MPFHSGLDDLVDSRQACTEQGDRVMRSKIVQSPGAPRVGEIAVQ